MCVIFDVFCDDDPNISFFTLFHFHFADTAGVVLGPSVQQGLIGGRNNQPVEVSFSFMISPEMAVEDRLDMLMGSHC